MDKSSNRESNRCGDSYRIIVFRYDSRESINVFLPFLCGGKPKKVNDSVENPLIANAGNRAEGPGNTVYTILYSIAV